MLTIVKIDSLFNQYSYCLELNPEESRVRFITGPNGYGKTTLLNILFAIYNMNLEVLSRISFNQLQLIFDDGNILQVKQDREIKYESGSDEEVASDLSLYLSFEKYAHDDVSYRVRRYKGNKGKFISERENADNVRLYFKSHPVYYIRDGRLKSPDGIPTVSRCVENMKYLLQISENVGNEDFQNKLKLFEDIINKAEFACKHIEIDKRFGFRYVSNNADKTILAPKQLSSGEQHLTIMAFELLFMAPDDSLVLIDEPEISLHMMWQLDFLKNIQSILKVRDMQVLIATHSPEIFNQKWSLSIDLYRLTQNESLN